MTGSRVVRGLLVLLLLVAGVVVFSLRGRGRGETPERGAAFEPVRPAAEGEAELAVPQADAAQGVEPPDAPSDSQGVEASSERVPEERVPLARPSVVRSVRPQPLPRAAREIELPEIEDADVSTDWMSWRGPYGSGWAPGPAPAWYGTRDEARWVAEVPHGATTPIIAGRRVWLTAAKAIEGEELSGSAPANADVSLELLCLDRKSGEVEWTRTVAVVSRRRWSPDVHAWLYQGCEAPATDGERIVMFSPWVGVFCYDVDGTLQWTFDTGPADPAGLRRSSFPHGGFDRAPVLHDRFVVIVDDDWTQIGGSTEPEVGTRTFRSESSLVALDIETGELLWRVSVDQGVRTESSPLVVENEDGAQVLIGGRYEIRGFDLETGEVLWELPTSRHGAPQSWAPVQVGDAAIALVGSRAAALRWAEPDEVRDVGGVLWSADVIRFCRAPLVTSDRAYVVNFEGTVQSLDLRTGAQRFKAERILVSPGFLASPVAAADRLYLVHENGSVVVARTSGTLEILSSDKVFDGERFLASPAIAHGSLFLRSDKRLYCFGGD